MRVHYGSYPQIEDGIGMVRAFHEEFAKLEKRLAGKDDSRQQASGDYLHRNLFAPVLTKAVEKLNSKLRTELSLFRQQQLLWRRRFCSGSCDR